MNTRISGATRADVVMVESLARPTPTPTRVNFGQVLAAGARGLVQGAELAASKLPGSPITATAVRAGAIAQPPSPIGLGTIGVGGVGIGGSAPEGPAGIGMSAPGGAANAGVSVNLGGAVGASDPTGGIDTSLQQSAQISLYYLQVQQQVDAQNRSFTALSNVLKTEHDSAKAAIQNIHS